MRGCGDTVKRNCGETRGRGGRRKVGRAILSAEASGCGDAEYGIAARRWTEVDGERVERKSVRSKRNGKEKGEANSERRDKKSKEEKEAK